MTGWRVWFAFEIRPGVTRAAADDRSATWRGLADSCRDASGKIDAAEFGRWLDCLVEHGHLWGTA